MSSRDYLSAYASSQNLGLHSSTSHLPQDAYASSARPLSNYPGPPPPLKDNESHFSHGVYGASSSASSTRHHESSTHVESNPFADDVPLREHPYKQSTDMLMPNHLPEDSTIVDRKDNANGRRTRKGPRNRKKDHAFFSWHTPWVVYIFTIIQSAVFIGELAKNATLTKSPIEVAPQFNPMIGPSPYVLINMGARYVPCMRKTAETLNATLSWPCPGTTNVTDPSSACELNDLCGFGDSAYSETNLPHQWFRFIVPIFLHAGFIHIGFNMIVQVLLGRDMEREIGSLRFLLVYLSSGIFGFVLGGNFAPEGIASTGASGSLFGIIALNLLDLLYHWGERRSPWWDLFWIFVEIGISFVLGLLPGLDNFSHIGGFLMGLALGICILHTPDVLRRRVGELATYTSTSQQSRSRQRLEHRHFTESPVGFFKGRKSLWWAWWLVRAAALLGVLTVFIVLLKNFWKPNPAACRWCKYLSCIDIKNWCDLGQLTFTQTPAPAPTSAVKRTFDASLALF